MPEKRQLLKLGGGAEGISAPEEQHRQILVIRLPFGIVFPAVDADAGVALEDQLAEEAVAGGLHRWPLR